MMQSLPVFAAFPAEPDTRVAVLGNGARVLTIRLPHLESVAVSVFVRTGSRHESRRLNGISHFVEHMAFKGTETRDCQRINLDAERLGAEVNAHTDKDHTAFHMRGLARDAEAFVHMLADIVRASSFPEAELERERQVILQEFTEDEDDPLSTAYKLFDKACFGMHPLAQPVIGTRRNIQQISRADLLDYVQRQYGACNVVIGVAGGIEHDRVVRAAEVAFGDMPRGTPNAVDRPAYVGGGKSKRQSGYSQTHVVLGFPIPGLTEDHVPSVVAAALFGEGMSSPLMDRIRERLGLVYYAACSADVFDVCGQFVIEASTSPEHLDRFFEEVTRLLAAQAGSIDPVALERARNQIAVRTLGAREKPFRRIEEGAQDLFAFGRLRPRSETAAQVEAVTAAQLRATFERLLATRAAVALAGKVPQQAGDRVVELVARRA